MPDGVVYSRDFVQTMDQGPVTMGLTVTAGNTIMYDSYTPEDEVRRRNVGNNNVSKLNQANKRFSSEFCVGVRASSITAILCASTVSDYRVIDKKTGQALTATDKRPDYMRTWNESQTKRQKITPQPTTAANVLLSSMPKPISTESNLIISRQNPPPLPVPSNPSLPAIVVSSKDPCPDDVLPGIFDILPANATPPRPFLAPELAFHVNQNLTTTLPDIMTFTSSSTTSPPLSPRNIDSENPPFPFKEHPMDMPVYNDPVPQAAAGTSDNVRAVVSVGDVMQHPPDIDDIHHGASILQLLSSTAPDSTKKQLTPPAKV